MTSTPWFDLLASCANHLIQAPPIRPSDRDRLTEVNAGVWATKPVDPLAIYLFDGPVRDVMNGPVDPYVAFGHVGHGENSNTVVVNIVTDRVGIFLQFVVGPVYTDFLRARLDIARGFVLLDRLLENAPTEPGTLDFVVAMSPVRRTFRLLERVGTVDGASEPTTNVETEWAEVDFKAIASQYGTPPSIDGGLFTWQEPIAFRAAASVLLATFVQG